MACSLVDVPIYFLADPAAQLWEEPSFKELVEALGLFGGCLSFLVGQGEGRWSRRVLAAVLVHDHRCPFDGVAPPRSLASVLLLSQVLGILAPPLLASGRAVERWRRLIDDLRAGDVEVHPGPLIWRRRMHACMRRCAWWTVVGAGRTHFAGGLKVLGVQPRVDAVLGEVRVLDVLAPPAVPAPKSPLDGAVEFVEFEVRVPQSCMPIRCAAQWLCRRLLLLARDVELHPGPARKGRCRASRRGVDLLTHDIEETTRRIYETRLEEMHAFYAPKGFRSVESVIAAPAHAAASRFATFLRVQFQTLKCCRSHAAQLLSAIKRC